MRLERPVGGTQKKQRRVWRPRTQLLATDLGRLAPVATEHAAHVVSRSTFKRVELRRVRIVRVVVTLKNHATAR